MPERPFNADPLPSYRLGELAAWVLEVKCGRCKQRARLPFSVLIERHGPELEIWRVPARLRCSRLKPLPAQDRCGGKPMYVALMKYDIHGKSARLVREIVLMQPKAR